MSGRDCGECWLVSPHNEQRFGAMHRATRVTLTAAGHICSLPHTLPPASPQSCLHTASDDHSAGRSHKVADHPNVPFSACVCARAARARGWARSPSLCAAARTAVSGWACGPRAAWRVLSWSWSTATRAQTSEWRWLSCSQLALYKALDSVAFVGLLWMWGCRCVGCVIRL